MLFQIRRKNSQRTHPWRKLLGERARAMMRHHHGHHFLFHKAPRPIARRALLIAQEFFNSVVIERRQRHSGERKIDSMMAAISDLGRVAR